MPSKWIITELRAAWNEVWKVAHRVIAIGASANVRFLWHRLQPARSTGRRWRTLNIAHRGSSGTHPENTISAFLAAADEGADMCELDVQETRDGAVVVIHDETVDRTTDGQGAVAALMIEEIQRLDASFKFPSFRGERIPTLDEVLKA